MIRLEVQSSSVKMKTAQTDICAVFDFYSSHRKVANHAEWYQHGSDSLCVVNWERAMTGKVKCRNCGYLALRNLNTRQLVEVEFGVRNEEEFPAIIEYVTESMFPSATPVYDTNAVCFRGETDFFTETKNAKDASLRHTDFHAIINRDRDCKSFTEAIYGLSPKEHLDMNLQERKDWRDLWKLVIELTIVGSVGIVGIIVGVISIQMQLKGVQMQIDAQREMQERSERFATLHEPRPTGITESTNPNSIDMTPAAADSPINKSAP